MYPETGAGLFSIFKIQQIIAQAGALLSLEKVWVSLQSTQHRVHLFLLNEHVLDVHLDEMGSYPRWRFCYEVFRTGPSTASAPPSTISLHVIPFPQQWCLEGYQNSMITVSLDVCSVTRSFPRTVTKSLSFPELTTLLQAPGSSQRLFPIWSGLSAASRLALSLPSF